MQHVRITCEVKAFTGVGYRRVWTKRGMGHGVGLHCGPDRKDLQPLNGEIYNPRTYTIDFEKPLNGRI